MADLNFDATTVEPAQERGAIPAGYYDCVITKTEVKPTKDERGKYLELKLQVLRGPYQNAVLFDRINLWNNNDQAVEIAKRTLSAICHAIGVMQVKQSEQLQGKPLEIKVATGEYNGKATNEVKSYAKEGQHAGTEIVEAPVATKSSPFA